MSSAGISYKNVIPWDDTTYPYREGYPQKDLKAPARKEQLTAAMEEADVRGSSAIYAGGYTAWKKPTDSVLLLLLL